MNLDLKEVWCVFGSKSLTIFTYTIPNTISRDIIKDDIFPEYLLITQFY